MATLYAQIIVNTLVLSVMDILNFAHGAIYMIGSNIFYIFLMKAGLPYFLSAILAIVLTGFLGILLERYLLRPAGTAP